MRYARVDGHPSLVRDKKSGAIININNNEAEMARVRKHRRQQQAEENEQLKSDVDQLKNDVGEIKDLLRQLIEK